MPAAITILAFMGYAGIPLDVMPITIEAITFGTGVDDAIHYLPRFRGEVDAGKSIREVFYQTQGSTGSALNFTSFDPRGQSSDIACVIDEDLQGFE